MVDLRQACDPHEGLTFGLDLPPVEAGRRPVCPKCHRLTTRKNLRYSLYRGGCSGCGHDAMNEPWAWLDGKELRF